MKQEKKYILIIDDNPDDRELIQEFLKKGNLEDSFSFEVEEAVSLESALNKIEERKPDCILLDYLLPDVKGLEALPVLRQKLHSGMCVILLTGGGNEEIVVQAFRGGVMDYLQKGSFMPSELCHSVEVAIHRKEVREELKLKRLELRKSNESLKEANQLLRERQQELIRMQLKTSIAMVDIEKESERKSRELQEAKQLQLSMLPHVSPELPHLDMAMFMKTCVEVGGDYYDYKIDAHNNLTVIIGDATGHGVRAGIVVATVKSYFHTMGHDVSPAEMIYRVSEGIRNLQVRNMYMGLTIMRLQEGGTLTIASSGMPPLLYYQQEYDKVEEILIKGLFLGSSLQEKVETKEIKVQPGDVLLAMSDGLPELFNPQKEMLDYDRIRQRFAQVVDQPAEQIIRAMENLSQEWANSGDINDDIALIAMKMK
ncbi:SpoIIE family protein phosphatase [Nafulsella turpanensis]|uniref:SpoIIE family protein phosphatase n=1 Tax=Nafulsella turpanensis TaxID=1265690 RepID=UPI0003475318|nr:fused response regulator/phosphatase [Nafulsella turpanensis]